MKLLLKSLGVICVGLGFTGAFLPLMPTTPFLLLALFFFARSSPEYSKRVLNNKILGPYIAGYVSEGGIPIKVKVKVIALLWATMLVSIFFFTDNVYMRLVLVLIAAGVTLHICLKKTAPRH